MKMPDINFVINSGKTESGKTKTTQNTQYDTFHLWLKAASQNPDTFAKVIEFLMTQIQELKDHTEALKARTMELESEFAIATEHPEKLLKAFENDFIELFKPSVVIRENRYSISLGDPGEECCNKYALMTSTEGIEKTALKFYMMTNKDEAQATEKQMKYISTLFPDYDTEHLMLTKKDAQRLISLIVKYRAVINKYRIRLRIMTGYYTSKKEKMPF